MERVKDSKTEQILLKAFSLEAQLRSRYDLCRIIAEKDGYDYIAKTFQNVSNNHNEHAKLWYKWLHNGEFPKTPYVLKQVTSEKYASFIEQYEEFAKVAREEGFDHIADLFEHICSVEKENFEKFKKLLYGIQNANIEPDADGNFNWECSVCGASIVQKEMPEECVLCLNEDVFFFKRPFDN